MLTIYPSRKTPGIWCATCYGTKGVSARFKGIPKSDETKQKLSANRANRQRGESHHSWKGGPIPHICLQCGKEFTVSRRRANAESARFCGTECWYEFIRADPENHPAWRGGYQPYYGPNWLKQARLVRERDGHRCQGCGKAPKKQALPVHHIRAFRTFERWQDANVLSNLVTLCKNCHAKDNGRGRKFHFQLSLAHVT